MKNTSYYLKVYLIQLVGTFFLLGPLCPTEHVFIDHTTNPGGGGTGGASTPQASASETQLIADLAKYDRTDEAYAKLKTMKLDDSHVPLLAQLVNAPGSSYKAPERAIEFLGGINTSASTASLLKITFGGSTIGISEPAVKVLSTRDLTGFEPELTAITKKGRDNSSTKVMNFGLSALLKINTPASTDGLFEHLGTWYGFMRNEVLLELPKRTYSPTNIVTIKGWIDGTDAQFQKVGMGFLVGSNTPATTQALKDLLQSSTNPDVVLAVANEIGSRNVGDAPWVLGEMRAKIPGCSLGMHNKIVGYLLPLSGPTAKAAWLVMLRLDPNALDQPVQNHITGILDPILVAGDEALLLDVLTPPMGTTTTPSAKLVATVLLAGQFAAHFHGNPLVLPALLESYMAAHTGLALPSVRTLIEGPANAVFGPLRPDLIATLNTPARADRAAELLARQFAADAAVVAPLIGYLLTRIDVSAHTIPQNAKDLLYGAHAVDLTAHEAILHTALTGAGSAQMKGEAVKMMAGINTSTATVDIATYLVAFNSLAGLLEADVVPRIRTAILARRPHWDAVIDVFSTAVDAPGDVDLLKPRLERLADILVEMRPPSPTSPTDPSFARSTMALVRYAINFIKLPPPGVMGGKHLEYNVLLLLSKIVGDVLPEVNLRVVHFPFLAKNIEDFTADCMFRLTSEHGGQKYATAWRIWQQYYDSKGAEKTKLDIPSKKSHEKKS